MWREADGGGGEGGGARSFMCPAAGNEGMVCGPSRESGCQTGDGASHGLAELAI